MISKGFHARFYITLHYMWRLRKEYISKSKVIFNYYTITWPQLRLQIFNFNIGCKWHQFPAVLKCQVFWLKIKANLFPAALTCPVFRHKRERTSVSCSVKVSDILVQNATDIRSLQSYSTKCFDTRCKGHPFPAVV